MRRRRTHRRHDDGHVHQPQHHLPFVHDVVGEGKVAAPPKEARAHTEEGAIAFSEWYQLQMGEALKTAESATLRSYSQDCAVCDGLGDVADDFRERDVRAKERLLRIRQHDDPPA